tara:strand:- start:258 stop:1127 length:870 start_codon:yes stop_codon:yes gene_type:complete
MGLLTGTDATYYAANGDHGGYQFVTLDDIVNNFIVAYVGGDKLISKVKRLDVAFHAQRTMQELSYDTTRSEKSQEIEIGPSLTMTLPRDYVNYVKLTWVDSTGIERVMHPARKTSNPLAILQAGDFSYTADGAGALQSAEDSDTWGKFKTQGSSTNEELSVLEEDNSYGQRFGLDPQFSHVNGTFFIDPIKSKIYFSSGLVNSTVTIKYISDSLGTDAEMVVHKFAEEAMYKSIAYAILSTRINTPEYIVGRFKKERAAAIRLAKLRLSNLKTEEINQVMKGKSKHIKH